MSKIDRRLGHSSAEIQRLKKQGLLRPITERLLRSAGIDAGMRVLDLGCGAGDVSILAAQLVAICAVWLDSDHTDVATVVTSTAIKSRAG